MDAITRTKKLQRVDLPVSWLLVNSLNPNQMTDAEFNLLTDNIEKMGITDPILVRPHPEYPGKYRIVGGAHRFEVAKILGFEEVPCTVVTDPDFDEDQEKFQIVRHNVIKGKMTPEKFMKLYESLGQKYETEILKDAFGFASEVEFQKMIKQVQKTLPKEMQESFKEAAKEIKTVDDLSKVLNNLFSKYGDSLPYGYMLIDFGGKESVWLRMSNQTKKALLSLGHRCRMESRTVDDIVGGLIELASNGKLEDQLAALVKDSDPVVVPSAFVGLPTAESLQGSS